MQPGRSDDAERLLAEEILHRTEWILTNRHLLEGMWEGEIPLRNEEDKGS